MTDTPINPREVPPVPSLLSPYRLGCSTFAGPSQDLNSAVHGAVANSVLRRDNAPRRSVWRLRHFSGVCPLLLERNPCAVVGTVPLVVIDTLNRQRFDIPVCEGPRRKRRKTVLPFRADGDAAPAVVFKRPHVRVLAAGLHVRPATVKMCPHHAVRPPFTYSSASARRRVAAAKFLTINDRFRPAVTDTTPKGVCPRRVAKPLHNEKFAVAVSGQINQWNSHAAA